MKVFCFIFIAILIFSCRTLDHKGIEPTSQEQEISTQSDTINFCKPGALGCAERVSVGSKSYLLIVDESVSKAVKTTISEMRTQAQKTGVYSVSVKNIEGNISSEKGHFPNPTASFDVFRPSIVKYAN